jgi:uncharacterized protein (TIGR03067 family)
MLTKVFCVGCLFISTLAIAADFPPPAQAELTKLSGKWRIVSTERDGQSEAKPAEPTLVQIEEDRVLLNGKEVGLRITMLAVESQPKLIDISHPETKKTLEGIYELKEEEWRICLNTEGEGARDRPSDFKTAGKVKFVTILLKRDKD